MPGALDSRSGGEGSENTRLLCSGPKSRSCGSGLSAQPKRSVHRKRLRYLALRCRYEHELYPTLRSLRSRCLASLWHGSQDSLQKPELCPVPERSRLPKRRAQGMCARLRPGVPHRHHGRRGAPSMCSRAVQLLSCTAIKLYKGESLR